MIVSWSMNITTNENIGNKFKFSNNDEISWSERTKHLHVGLAIIRASEKSKVT